MHSLFMECRAGWNASYIKRRSCFAVPTLFPEPVLRLKCPRISASRCEPGFPELNCGYPGSHPGCANARPGSPQSRRHSRRARPAQRAHGWIPEKVDHAGNAVAQTVHCSAVQGIDKNVGGRILEKSVEAAPHCGRCLQDADQPGRFHALHLRCIFISDEFAQALFHDRLIGFQRHDSLDLGHDFFVGSVSSISRYRPWPGTSRRESIESAFSSSSL